MGNTGEIGWVFDTCYFESNKMRDIIVNSTLNINIIHSVLNCIFNKSGAIISNTPRITFTNGRTTNTTSQNFTGIAKGNAFSDYGGGSTFPP